MRIVVAPDSFKGSLSSREVGRIIKGALQSEMKNVQVDTITLADGGEGTCAALLDATNGKRIEVIVTNPVGEKIKTYYGLLGDKKSVVIEMALIAGYSCVPEELRNPLKLTTYGLGECLIDVLERGYRNIIIGIGGSATNDGGLGMLQALGIRFFDKEGRELPAVPTSLLKICSVDFSTIDKRVYEANIIVASDVDNPLCGPQGASYVFGPQKGATEEQIKMLDEGLYHFAHCVEKHLQQKFHHLPGAGAAGGVGFALMAIGGKIKSGASVISEYAGLDEKLQKADLLITGEGKTDEQTLLGKLPYYVAMRAKKYGVKCLLISGTVDYRLESLYDVFYSMHSIVNGPINVKEAITEAEYLLDHKVRNLARLMMLEK